MKRISMLAAALSSLALAIAALGAVSASAAEDPIGVFCSSAPASHECGGSTYPLGTELTANLSKELRLATSGGTTFLKCSQSTWQSQVGESGTLATTGFSLSGCTSTFQILRLGSAQLRWKEGTDNGHFASGLGRVAEIQTKFLGVNCTFVLIAPGQSGPGSVVGGSPARFVYEGDRVQSETGGLCPSTLYATGEYTVNSPTSLYVEKP
jgi:hypothetical protein